MAAATTPREGALPQYFGRLWLGETVSSFGTYVTLLSLQFLVLRTLHGGPQDVGWLNSARWLPYLVLGLFAGVIVDRRRRLPVIVITDLVCGSLLALIPVAWVLGALSLPVLIGIVLLYGATALFNDASSMAFLPRLVPTCQLQRAHARLDGSSAVAQTAGPTLAGGLIAILGAPWAILVDALSYFFSAAMMASVRVTEPGPAATAASSVRRDIRDGLTWVYRAGAQRWLALGTHLWFAANATLGVAVPTFALHTLHLSAVQFGTAPALAGVGAGHPAVAREHDHAGREPHGDRRGGTRGRTRHRRDRHPSGSVARRTDLRPGRSPALRVAVPRRADAAGLIAAQRRSASACQRCV